MKKNKIIVLVSFICLFTINSLFAQHLSDQEIGLNVERITKRLKEKKLNEEEIKIEINQLREIYTTQYVEQQRLQEELFKKDFNNNGESYQRNINTINSIVPQAERDALIALYNATDGNNWTNTINGQGVWPVNDPSVEVESWNSSTNTGWYGVTVSNGHVVAIALNGVNGTISNLSALTYLESLSLTTLTSTQTLSGSLDGLQNLSNLRFLNISANYQNNFNSIIPICGLLNLETLYLSGSNFNQELPIEFFNLTNLKKLRLSGCNFTLALQNVGTYLTNLEELWLSGNFQETSIPASFLNLTNLKKIYLGIDNLSGGLNVIGNLIYLTHIKFYSCNFSGALPSNFANLQNLQFINFDFNHVTDISPLCNVTSLKYLSFNYNEIDQFPTNFNNLSNLKYIGLSANNLEGNIPTYFTNMVISTLFITGNDLEGVIPPLTFDGTLGYMFLSESITAVGTFGISRLFYLGGNKFTFKDFEAQASYYESFIQNYFLYAPQAKTDSIVNENASVGSSYTMTMHENGNYSSVEEYQWYKGTYPSGIAISGATSRQYIIGSVSTSDTGSYYCLSTHPDITISSNNSKNLVLQREQINLSVADSSCTVSNPNSNYVQGLLVDLLAHLIQRKQNGDPDSAIEGSTPVELIALAPYITDPNPVGIYNFHSAVTPTGVVDIIQFSFSLNHTVDVLLDSEAYVSTGLNNLNSNNFQFDLSEYDNAEDGIEFYTEPYSYGDFHIKGIGLKHIEFCPDELVSCTASNPNSDTVKQLFINLVNHLITQNSLPNGYTCQELTLLAPYVQPDSPVAIYNFTNTGYYLRFSFADHGSNFDVQIPYNGSTVVGIDLLNYTSYDESIQINTYLSNGQIDTSKGSVKHIEFCPNELAGSCTATNPNSAIVKQLFIDLVNRLIAQNSLPNGFSCQELTLLAPYVQPDDPVAIYNFINTGDYIRFSFANHGRDFDVQIPYYGSTVVDIDLLNYISYNEFFQINTYLSNGEIDTSKGFVKHIEFCPDELYCKHHVAIVIDESGSIDLYEAQNVKKQLKSFIDKQLYDNDNLGTNMYVSFIGLSDSDTNSRTSGIANGGNNILNQKVSSTNIQQFYSWISGYRSGRVSPSSDYWKSGLDVALTTDAELVILITDGSQTSNTQGLFNTVRSFNNNNGGNGNLNAPHLYVIGIEDGFYVDDPSSASSAYNRISDPNLNPELRQSQNSINGRVTSYLRKSLKYLMGYLNTDFPVEDKYKIHYNLNGQMVDYYGDEDFRFLMLEPNYISNALVDDPDVQYDDNYALSCGNIIPLENCNNCINFQLDKGKEYILSAWVKEEQNLQVKSFDNPRIFINFLDINGNRILSPNDPYDPGISGSIPWPYYAEGKTKGDIIDGWQRIFQKFIVPTNAVYINVELINKSQNIPAYFDDVRIHPKEGSMKSFVYDPETFRLMSELDENNYSTFYEYDKEGGLIRVKKETSKGVKTIQETRSGNVIKLN
ncbi:hypothetical protein [Flavobacterium sp. U410]